MKLKKITAIIMAAAIAMSFTACSEETLTPEQMYDNAIKSMEEVKTLDSNVTTDMTIAADGTELSVKADMNVKYDMSNAEEIKFSSIGTTEVLGMSVPTETYYLEGYSYASSNGTKYKVAVPLEDLMSSLPTSSTMIYSDSLTDVSSETNVDGNTIISYSVTPEALKETVDASLAGVLEMMNITADITISSSSGTLILDADGNTLSQTNIISVETNDGTNTMIINMSTIIEYNSINEEITIEYPTDLDSYEEITI